MADATVDLRDAMKTRMVMHVRIRGIKRLRVRVWLGAQLLRLAAWVIGTGIEIEGV